jgi:hypothetical protein
MSHGPPLHIFHVPRPLDHPHQVFPFSHVCLYDVQMFSCCGISPLLPPLVPSGNPLFPPGAVQSVPLLLSICNLLNMHIGGNEPKTLLYFLELSVDRTGIVPVT